MTITTDEKIFKTFWQDERDNSPRWYNDASKTWTCSWEDFLDFCRAAERVYYIEGSALLYVKRYGNNAEIHFSVIRGKTVDVDDLLRIREELLRDFDAVWGWVGKHNRGLRKIVEECGLRRDGVKMYQEFSHGKLLEWWRYIITKEFNSKSEQDLLIS